MYKKVLSAAAANRRSESDMTPLRHSMLSAAEDGKKKRNSVAALGSSSSSRSKDDDNNDSSSRSSSNASNSKSRVEIAQSSSPPRKPLPVWYKNFIEQKKSERTLMSTREAAAIQFLCRVLELQTWIMSVLQPKFDSGKLKPREVKETPTGQDLCHLLEDGILLCELINAIRPGTIRKIHYATTNRFRQYENVLLFLDGFAKISREAEEKAKTCVKNRMVLFTPQDLTNNTNIDIIVDVLVALAAAADTLEFKPALVRIKRPESIGFTQDVLRSAMELKITGSIGRYFMVHGEDNALEIAEEDIDEDELEEEEIPKEEPRLMLLERGVMDELLSKRTEIEKGLEDVRRRGSFDHGACPSPSFAFREHVAKPKQPEPQQDQIQEETATAAQTEEQSTPEEQHDTQEVIAPQSPESGLAAAETPTPKAEEVADNTNNKEAELGGQQAALEAALANELVESKQQPVSGIDSQEQQQPQQDSQQDDLLRQLEEDLKVADEAQQQPQQQQQQQQSDLQIEATLDPEQAKKDAEEDERKQAEIEAQLEASLAQESEQLETAQQQPQEQRQQDAPVEDQQSQDKPSRKLKAGKLSIDISLAREQLEEEEEPETHSSDTPKKKKGSRKKEAVETPKKKKGTIKKAKDTAEADPATPKGGLKKKSEKASEPATPKKLKDRKELDRSEKAAKAKKMLTVKAKGNTRRSWNADEIVPGVYVGDKNAAHNKEALQERGITHILSAIGNEPAFPDDFKYYTFEVLDTSHQDLMSHFPKTSEFIDEGRNAGGVLVHCMQGISRSCSLVLAFLMSKLGYSFYDAADLACQKRPVCCPNLGFIKQLQLYENMGCSLEGDSPYHEQYKNFQRKHRLAVLYQKWKTTHTVDDMMDEEPEPDQVTDCISCKVCKLPLAKKSSVIPHNNGEDFWGDKADTDNKCPCDSVFVYPSRWLADEINSYNYIPPSVDEESEENNVNEIKELRSDDSREHPLINCPHCAHEIGTWDWTVLACSCGFNLRPGFRLKLSEIEID